jgi:hypothetical protein
VFTDDFLRPKPDTAEEERVPPFAHCSGSLRVAAQSFFSFDASAEGPGKRNLIAVGKR